MICFKRLLHVNERFSDRFDVSSSPEKSIFISKLVAKDSEGKMKLKKQTSMQKSIKTGILLLLIISVCPKFLQLYAGGDLGISRGGGGGGFSKKKSENFVDLFFRLTKLIFWALSKHSKDRNLTKFLRRRPIFEKRQKKKGVFRCFLKNVE